jgi:polysaccharide export outer membrane protein
MNSRAGLIRLFFSICLGISSLSAFGAQTNDASPAPAVAAQSGDATGAKTDLSRKLSPNDVISITVYGEDDLTVKSTIIDENGMIMLPFLDQIKVSGKTVAQARELIRQLYDKDYLVNPQVNVIVDKFANRRFSVLGQVQKPDRYEFPQSANLNLLDAIAIAGGYTRLANHSKVEVRRLENGAIKIYHLDAEKMAKDASEKPFEILPDDNISVSERAF